MDETLILSSIAFAAIYITAADRLTRFGAEYRDSALKQGVALLRRTDLPPDLRHSIETLLTRVPYPKTAWSLALRVLPTAISFRHSSGVSAPGRCLRRKWNRFARAVLIASLCNSPGAALLCLVQLMVVSFALPAGSMVSLLVARTASKRF